ncbi:MAG: hypothetical protein Q7S48_00525 [bacterium]|nr:hypothetical protein [bacterium]
MPSATITTVKNGTIVLPKNIQKQWQGAQVYISAGSNDLFIKKLMVPSLAQLRPKLEALGKKITQKDITKAIKEARTAQFR